MLFVPLGLVILIIGIPLMIGEGWPAWAFLIALSISIYFGWISILLWFSWNAYVITNERVIKYETSPYGTLVFSTPLETIKDIVVTSVSATTNPTFFPDSDHREVNFVGKDGSHPLKIDHPRIGGGLKVPLIWHRVRDVDQVRVALGLPQAVPG